MRALLFYGNCFACHKIKESKSAPSIKKVKQRYLNAFLKKEDFVTYMSKWVVKPQRETSIMIYEIATYGLMPELGYDESVLREISAYIYDTDFKKLP